MIKENVAEVEARIQAACKRAGRRREEVTLIAVSKTKPVRDIYEVMETGIKDFGENKVQEMCDKMEMIQQPLNWHMIGHLQRNKVKYIVDKATLIHSVDSLRLAQQISQEAQKKSVESNILIEVNVAEEEEAAENGNERAQLALKVFVAGIVHYIGAFYVDLGGLDDLVFTAGIGENAGIIRKMVCDKLSALGVKMDEAKNASAHGKADLTARDSQVSVLVVPTDEELGIARRTYAYLRP